MWSEKHFFCKVQGVNVSKVALRYQNAVCEILARSVRCEDPRKIFELLEMLEGPKIKISIFFNVGFRKMRQDERIPNLVSKLKSDYV